MAIKILPEHEIQQAAHSFQQPPVLFANPINLYQRRVKRLRQLAENHPFADYLLFAAKITESQLALLNEKPLDKQNNNINGLLPLNIQTWQRSAKWREYLTVLLADIKPDANEQMLGTIDWLEKASHEQLEELADKLLAQDFVSVGTDKAVFLWAALSLYWLQLSQQLPHKVHQESAEGLHHCPICNSAPVASVVHFGSEQGLRYLHCALCETEWNMVRAKCSNCEQAKELDYWSLDQHTAAVKTESCGDCHSYLKILYQEKDPYVEPVADDLASIFLDMEMEQKGFARSGVNPFLFPAE